jgi:hypothetical protein
MDLDALSEGERGPRLVIARDTNNIRQRESQLDAEAADWALTTASTLEGDELDEGLPGRRRKTNLRYFDKSDAEDDSDSESEPDDERDLDYVGNNTEVSSSLMALILLFMEASWQA